MTTRRVALWTGAVLVAVVAAGFVAYRLFPTAPARALAADDAEVVALGARVYQAHCASCHGARLEGQPNWRERGPDGRLPAPPHDESGHTWHHPDEVLFRITKHGVASVVNMKDYASAMPVYDGVLTDEEIVAVLSWIKAQWPPAARERQEQVNRQYLETRRP
jgi:mono/diheme cytochrome c family protein